MQFVELARAIAGDLSACNAKFALVGGFAVSVHGEPRNTRDLDFAVAVPSDRAAEQLVQVLAGRGYAVLALLEQETTSRLATVRLSCPHDRTVIVDLLFATTGVENEIVAAATPIQILPDVSLPVASRGHLLAMKTLARDDRRRPLDRADILALLERATPADLEQARAGMRLIVQRGANRGRDLLAEFEALRRDHDRSG